MCDIMLFILYIQQVVAWKELQSAVHDEENRTGVLQRSQLQALNYDDT
jgi:RecG-like helicase